VHYFHKKSTFKNKRDICHAMIGRSFPFPTPDLSVSIARDAVEEGKETDCHQSAKYLKGIKFTHNFYIF
jgi:hypothetical protein